MGEGIRSGIGKELVAERKDNPYKKISDLQAHPLIKQQGIVLDTAKIGVISEHFLLNTKCVIGNSQINMVSMIHRGADNNLRVIKRSQRL